MIKTLSLDIKKQDEELHIVFGEVYAPNVPDSQGDFMEAVDIRKMGHQFMRSLKARKVDVNHDNNKADAAVVESFIATEDSEIYLAGAWVVGIKIDDPELWEKVINGEINGFSMEAAVISRKQRVTLEVPETIKGDTQDSGEKKHKHNYTIHFSDDGKFLGGKTNKVNGHDHIIQSGTITEMTNKHNHRYSFLEKVTTDGKN